MPAQVVAAEASQVTLAGAAVTIIAAILGWLGTRKSRPEAAAVLVDSALKLSAAATSDNAELRDRLDAAEKIIEDLAPLTVEVARLRAEVEECNRKHARAEAALAAAGIVIDDH